MSVLQLRRGTHAEWETCNPLLLEGEMGFETDTGLIKIGDGVTLWNDLPYMSGGTSGSSGSSGTSGTGASGTSGTNGTSETVGTPPVIVGITPVSGDPGTFISISGVNFINSAVTLKMDNVTITDYTIVNSNLITTSAVTNGLTNGLARNSIVKFNNAYGQTQYPWGINPNGGEEPVIDLVFNTGTSAAITTATWGQTIGLSGSNFGTSGYLSVLIGGVVQPCWRIGGNIYVTISSICPTITTEIEVITIYGSGYYQPFTIFSNLTGTGPTITSVSADPGLSNPPSTLLGDTTLLAKRGSNLTVIGDDFLTFPDPPLGYTQTGCTTVLIGNIGISTGYVSTTELNCQISNDVALGIQDLVVRTDYGTDTLNNVEICADPATFATITNAPLSGNCGDTITLSGLNFDKWHGNRVYIGPNLLVNRAYYIYPGQDVITYSPTTNYTNGWNRLDFTIPAIPYSGVVDIAVQAAIGATGPSTYNGYHVWTGFTLVSKEGALITTQIETATGNTLAESYSYTDTKYNLATGYTDTKVSGLTSVSGASEAWVTSQINTATGNTQTWVDTNYFNKANDIKLAEGAALITMSGSTERPGLTQRFIVAGSGFTFNNGVLIDIRPE